MVTFDDLALVYDKVINWKDRLNRELPFLKRFLDTHKTARVLDLACGSGRHATAFATEGHEVTGLDASQGMIDAATNFTAKKKTKVRYLVGNMQEVETFVEKPFDLILCLGNSLALLPSFDALERTIRGVRALLRVNGTFVAQVLNFQEIRRSNFRFFPMKPGTVKDGADVVFARFFETFTDSKTATLVFAGFVKQQNAWMVKLTTHEVLQLSQRVLESILQSAGFQEIEIFAGYDSSRFLPEQSRNLVIVCKV